MGQPAARIGDKVIQTGPHCHAPMHPAAPVPTPLPHPPMPIPLLTGSPNVVIGGMPAARLTDQTQPCLIPGCIPGGPGIVGKGSAGVKINGLPAARAGDLTQHAACVGPIPGPVGNVMPPCCPTVLIGEAGGGGGGGGDGTTGTANTTALARGAPQGGSTVVIVDDATHTVTIRTNMEFTGPGATDAYAAAAKQQIEATWGGSFTRNGQTYAVNVEITTRVNPTGTRTPGFDQIIVDPATTRMSQTLYGAGPGYQTPDAATDAARPRRIAHEYGHTLGLPDGYHDTPDGSRPNDPAKTNDIMSETWPDSSGTLPHPHQDDYQRVMQNHGW
jgi:uncharacterized Zn-binding protein involved in type VI secretion